MAGPLAGLRNALGVRRRFEAMMIESLKGLWTHVKESGGTKISHEARSLMRDAPDYEARAQYIPRHAPNQNHDEAQPDSGPRTAGTPSRGHWTGRPS
jgi:hypothetical protein